MFVHPFDNEDIIAGQGTIGLEILEQVPDVDTIIVGVGGGGLLAGLSTAVRAKEAQLGKKIRIIGVQAEHAAAYPLSLAADALVPLKKVSTIADGIAVGRPGQLPFSIIKELVDDVATGELRTTSPVPSSSSWNAISWWWSLQGRYRWRH